MTDEELAAIEARADAASEGPWFKEGNTVMTAHRDYTVVLFGNSAEDDWDADFIVAARSDVPALVASLRATRSALRQLLDDAWWATGGTVESGYVVSEDLIEAVRVLVSDVAAEAPKEKATDG